MKYLTIAVPTYNMEKYLSNCIDSMLGSTPDERLEIIIVNDGSKDNSLKIANDYKNKYPTIVKVIDKENGGYGSTINESLKVATGVYYRVVDSDDAVDTKQLIELLDCLEKETVDMLVTDYTQFFEDSDKTIQIKPEGFVQNIEYSIADTPIKKRIPMHMAFFKTEAIKSIRLLEKCFYVDVEYVAYCTSLCKTIKYIPLNVYRYRLGRIGQSVSLDGYYKHIDNLVLVANTLVDKYIHENNDYLYLEAKEALKTLYALLVSFYYKDKKMKVYMKEVDLHIKTVAPQIYEETNKILPYGVIKIIRGTNYIAIGVISRLKRWIRRR